MNGPTTQQPEFTLAGRRVALVGKLASMPRREAEQLIRRHGGIIEPSSHRADLLVLSDNLPDPSGPATGSAEIDDSIRAAVARDELQLLHESELWARLGLVDSGQGIERLYTPTMLAEIVHAPVSAVRHWHRRGALRAMRTVGRLPYFNFEEVGVARKLAELAAAGCSLSIVDRKLDELARLTSELPRPLADPAVFVEGRRLVIRRGDSTAEPSGQLLIDFDAAPADDLGGSGPARPVAIPFVAAADSLRKTSPPRGAHPVAAEDLRCVAAELEGDGRLDQAMEVYRAILVSGQFTAEDHFALAELLYRTGDLSAARERYYMAIELDEDFVEARSNLGCVLAEQGDVGLSEAAFRGALEFHPDYADAHYHLARLLDRADRTAEASRHWQLFINLAPASPWAEEAWDRLGAELVGE